jgi:DNA-directed RNA polymerase specialized sigma24 family protein
VSDSPPVSAALLTRLIRVAMGRGLPAPDAEDVVLRCYTPVSTAFDPKRGSFGALYHRAVENACRGWWRQRRRQPVLRLVGEPSVAPRVRPPAEERATANQERLIAALGPQERRVFATWALQRHLPRGRLTAKDAARSLDISVSEWENAKRRLRTRITKLLDDWGLEPRDLFSVEDDERPRRTSAR